MDAYINQTLNAQKFMGIFRKMLNIINEISME